MRLFFLFIAFSFLLNTGFVIANESQFNERVNDSFLSTSQLVRDSILPNSTSKYFDNYSDKFTLFIYGKQKYSSFGIFDQIKNKTLLYTPNKQLNMGIGFNYKWLGIGLAFNLGFINNDDDVYGKTQRMDWQTNIYGNKMVADFYLQLYRGYYIDNPEQVFSGWKDGNAPYVRPDIISISIGLSGMYIFNHKHFSYKAAFVQTAIQKKSAGSFLLGASTFIQAIAGDSSLFPKGSDFSNLPPVQAHSAFYFGIKSAYAYTFVHKQFFASLSLAATLEIGKVANQLEDRSFYVSWVPVIHMQPRFAIGYNKPKWYAGFSFVRDSYFEGRDYENSNYDFSFNSGNFRFFVGMRFNWFSKKQTGK